jgi:hypothetical protein
MSGRPRRLAGAEQAAEKGLHLAEMREERTAGAEARIDFAAFTARLKSCPDAPAGPRGVFPQPVKPAFILGSLLPD